MVHNEMNKRQSKLCLIKAWIIQILLMAAFVFGANLYLEYQHLYRQGGKLIDSLEEEMNTIALVLQQTMANQDNAVKKTWYEVQAYEHHYLLAELPTEMISEHPSALLIYDRRAWLTIPPADLAEVTAYMVPLADVMLAVVGHNQLYNVSINSNLQQWWLQDCAHQPYWADLRHTSTGLDQQIELEIRLPMRLWLPQALLLCGGILIINALIYAGTIYLLLKRSERTLPIIA